MKKRNVLLIAQVNTQKIKTALLFHFDTMSCHSLPLQKNSDSFYKNDMRIDAHMHVICAMLTLTYDALAPFVTFSLLMQQKSFSMPLCFQNLIIVILFSKVAQCICRKDFRRFKTQQQDKFDNVANIITFHPFSYRYTGCPIMPA